MKRLIGILVLVAAVIVTLIVVTGAEETDKKIVFTADVSEAQVGDTITATLSLEGFEDCDTFMFYDPIYNEDALEWVGGEWLIDGLMSDYYTEAEMNGGAEGRSGVLYAEDAIALEAADVVNFRFEVLEETGLTLGKVQLCGMKDWFSEDGSRGVVHLYVSDDFSGTLTPSEEGRVMWVPLDKLGELPLANGMATLVKMLLEGKYSEQFFNLENGVHVEYLK